MAGGYTVAQGDWGNFDAIAGFRLLDVNARVNYSLGLTIEGPRGNGATFGGIGSVSGSGDIWNGIGGFRGRLRLGNAGLFIPYYFDIGAGGSNLTWQISSGLATTPGWPTCRSPTATYPSTRAATSSSSVFGFRGRC